MERESPKLQGERDWIQGRRGKERKMERGRRRDTLLGRVVLKDN